MRRVAARMGVRDSFGTAPVGVFFGRAGRQEPGVEVDDPFFAGAGPRRTGCTECGECMTGCRHNAKNTLLKNYLYLAEAAGAQVHPLTTVTAVRPLPAGGYAVDTVRSGAWLPGRAEVQLRLESPAGALHLRIPGAHEGLVRGESPASAAGPWSLRIETSNPQDRQLCDRLRALGATR